MVKSSTSATAGIAVKKRPAAASSVTIKGRPAAVAPPKANAQTIAASSAGAPTNAARSTGEASGAFAGRLALLSKVAACLREDDGPLGETLAAGYASLNFGPSPRHPWEEEVAAAISQHLAARERALREEAAPTAEARPDEAVLEALKTKAAERAAVAKRQASAEQRAVAALAEAEAGLVAAREAAAAAAERSRDLRQMMAQKFGPLQDGTALASDESASPSAAKRLRLLDGASGSTLPSASSTASSTANSRVFPRTSLSRAPGHVEALLTDVHRVCRQAGVLWPSSRVQWPALLRPPAARTDLETQAINRLEEDMRHAVAMAELTVMSGPQAAMDLERVVASARQERELLAEEAADGAAALAAADARLAVCRAASKAARRSEVLRPAAEAKLAALLDGPLAAFRELETRSVVDDPPCNSEDAPEVAGAMAVEEEADESKVHVDDARDETEDPELAEITAVRKDVDETDVHADDVEEVLETPKPRLLVAPQRSEGDTPKMILADVLLDAESSPAKHGSPTHV